MVERPPRQAAPAPQIVRCKHIPKPQQSSASATVACSHSAAESLVQHNNRIQRRPRGKIRMLESVRLAAPIMRIVMRFHRRRRVLKPMFLEDRRQLYEVREWARYQNEYLTKT
jgi:hypothetical protein